MINQLKKIVCVLILFYASFLTAQFKYKALNIDPLLKKNSNALVRNNTTEISIESIDEMVIKQYRVVTVFNKSGQSKVKAIVYYNNSTTIKKIEAKIYNSIGEEIKKYRKKDFNDVSVADGFSIFNDNRAKYFDYTPTSYPYTVEFITEIIKTNTAFIPKWYPIEGYYVGTEFSSFKIVNHTKSKLAKKEVNFKAFKELEKQSEFHYTASHILPLGFEAYAPSFTNFTPHLKLALNEFSMEGIKGTNRTWKDFGKWINDKLLAGTNELPEDVINEVKTLTEKVDSPLEKAKLVYEYVQNKSRYVSIQIGIGGWKPMLAKDVDRLSYGDCKGLTNYTKSLLETIGIKSYYTVVYGDSDIRNLDKDFSSLEGNHAILTIPTNERKEGYVWLECTSQVSPFGYCANFTDNRDVLMVTPEGGTIVHSNSYPTLGNIQETIADIKIDENGHMSSQLTIVSKGAQYDNHTNLEFEPKNEQILFYKKHFGNIKKLQVDAIQLNNNKETIVFTELLKFNSEKYATKVGNMFLVVPNLFNRETKVPKRYENRTLPFEIDRGFHDIDTYNLEVPNHFSFDTLPEPIVIKNKFGSYEVTMTKIAANKISYKRVLIINNGKYLKEDYKDFRNFNKEIVKADKQSLIINKVN